jgi:hypothetical protein
VLLSTFTLILQLSALFVCCSGLGLAFRFLIPKEFSPLNKVLFSLIGGLFLVVLIPQNLVYLGVPVRISAWVLLAAALAQVWLCRHNFVAWIRTYSSNAELRTLATVALLTMTLHGIAPIQQGLERYYGKGYPDQLNYVQLAEFLKEVPYGTGAQDIGLRPWLVRTAIEFKKERIGQSIITAEISVWSGTDGKGGYAATMIFFLTLLAVCLYVSLRETGIDRFMAGSGALLAAFVPVVTRLSLDGFLSQISILFVFPFFASLLRHEELSARSFTLFFSFTLAYLVAAYSEITPIGFGIFFLGVMLLRHDTFRLKRLVLMSAILLIALVNLYYLRNLIEFLEQQYYLAAYATLMDDMMPKILTLRGWSELIFGAIGSEPFALFFDYCSLLLGLLCLTGAILLSRRDQLLLGVIVFPFLFVIFFFATRSPPSSYPIAKLTITIFPFVIGLVLVGLYRLTANHRGRSIGVLGKLLSACLVAAAAIGSLQYYSQVLNNGGLLNALREPRFLNICQELEEIKNKRVLVFENDPLLTPWLCYHARHSDVYYDNRSISDSPTPTFSPFAKIPDLANIDFVATRDRIIDLRPPSVSCLRPGDSSLGLAWADGHVCYQLGPPSGLPFLALLRPVRIHLKCRLTSELKAATLSIDVLPADDPSHVSQGEIWGKNVDVRRMNFPRGLSALRLLVTPKGADPNTGPSFSVYAESDG